MTATHAPLHSLAAPRTIAHMRASASVSRANGFVTDARVWLFALACVQAGAFVVGCAGAPASRDGSADASADSFDGDAGAGGDAMPDADAATSDGLSSEGGIEWPNASSRANSDPWIAEHHNEIGVMRPRVLVLNFVNRLEEAPARRLVDNVIAAVAESSRPRGYENPAATPFLQYEVARVVDMRDHPAPAGWTLNNSSLFPRRPTPDGTPWNPNNPLHNPNRYVWGVDYTQFFSRAFADRYAISDPASPGRALDLCGLLDAGLVHEVWIVADADMPDAAAAEVLETMPVYDADRRRVPGEFQRCAGNGCFDRDVPHCERSVRIGFINHTRGVGCYMESLAHGMEGMSNSDAIPYLVPYFREFAGFDLDVRHMTPFDSWYACRADNCVRWTGGTSVSYTTPRGSGTIANYVPVCGNAHFPPNGRQHYDVRNPAEVLSTCQGYRRGEGSDGRDLARPYSAALVARYDRLAPDCTGMWIVWWRQNWPGFRNPLRDDRGGPMLNWWPFLFY